MWYSLSSAGRIPMEMSIFVRAQHKFLFGLLAIFDKLLLHSLASSVNKTAFLVFSLTIPRPYPLASATRRLLTNTTHLSTYMSFCINRNRFGLSDPLACVRWNGLDVGRTRVVKKSTSPAWDESFQVRGKGRFKLDCSCLKLT